MGQGMGIRHRATRTSGSSARGHPTHHWARLAYLRPSWCRNSRMHLLHHRRSRVSSVRMLSGHWVVAGGKPVWRHALMGRKRLRHHHC
jgi:hypothetical protein